MTTDNELIDQILSILPALPKKLFGEVRPFEEKDLHPTHLHILHMVEQDGPLPMKTVAEKLSIKKSNLSPLVGKLIEHGLLEKKKYEKDRRVTLIRLTGEGEAFLSNKKHYMKDKMRERLESLTREERETLHNTFSNLAVILDKMNR
ncbi:MarR family winged helix-turn-helix transcriptional regulator [Salimicrobium salexigens]|uniref:Transcriptional regulator, MarR family n=1 Tax=Salimicrobium salexigens TaxID=908941 RepID=A0ABY1L0A4_9BACI|nr:winged helix DNA-binding protein [Salimicrobium salexigens]SIT00893.1 transcriptional regulator, MarR family [Salimicrobium salexigens]